MGRFGASLSAIVALLAAASPAGAQTSAAPAAEGPRHAQAAPATPLFPLREASGTSWLPDETPMSGVMQSRGAWQLMWHGNLFLQAAYEATDRHRTGVDDRRQIASPNWGMFMARRAVGAGRLGLRTMLTGEPWTVDDCGFLNLLATGEVCDGDSIHDRQHPHDLFMELAVDYDRPLGGSLRWQVYAGLSGEPALGPTGFPHRPSALSNPIAPITHHWLDSSHITFGLVTSGVSTRRWKAEVSAFNAREPDADRADLDLGALDSVSGRLTFVPTARLAMQVSAGHLREAEPQLATLSRSDVFRATASATYHRWAEGDRLWATTIAYGINAGTEIVAGLPFDITTHAVLAESALTFGSRHTLVGRAELVGKPAHTLHAHEYARQVFPVGKFEAGYVRNLPAWHHLVLGMGGLFSLNVVPSDLAPRYEGRVTPGVAVFLQLRPATHRM